VPWALGGGAAPSVNGLLRRAGAIPSPFYGWGGRSNVFLPMIPSHAQYRSTATTPGRSRANFLRARASTDLYLTLTGGRLISFPFAQSAQCAGCRRRFPTTAHVRSGIVTFRRGQQGPHHQLQGLMVNAQLSLPVPQGKLGCRSPDVFASSLEQRPYVDGRPKAGTRLGKGQYARRHAVVFSVHHAGFSDGLSVHNDGIGRTGRRHAVQEQSRSSRGGGSSF